MPSGRLSSFEFPAGRVLAGRYLIERKLGTGWEGEVYKIREIKTGIERAAKFYFPHRNPRDRAAIRYARKLNKLRGCPIVVQYHHQDHIRHKRQQVAFLVSEYVDGQLLGELFQAQPGGRLAPFEALHLLYALARGVECIHLLKEYHGDIHPDNIIVRRSGVHFVVKLIDLFDLGAPTREKIADDVVDLVHVFFRAAGGARHYSRQPDFVKNICKGLKRSLIVKQFKNAGQLRAHLETFAWPGA